MQTLIREYRTARITLQKALEHAEEQDKDKLRGMISDLSFAIEWMRTGVNPYGRGLQVNQKRKETYEQRSMLEREVLVDPQMLQSIHYQKSVDPEITPLESMWLEQALGKLKPKQREAYVLNVGRLWSFSMVAEHMGITKQAAQQLVDRAKVKIAQSYKSLSHTG